MHAELPDNLAGVLPAADSAELDGLLENAPHVFPETFTQHRYVNVPMETRGLVAEWDVGAKQLEVVLACQGVHDAAGVLRPDAGPARRRHPHHHGRCGRVVRAEGFPDPGRAGHRGGGHGPR